MTLPATIRGATHTGLQLTWKRADGSAVDLTGGTITGRMKSADGVVRAITGSLMVVAPPTNGVFRWMFAEADVAVAGVFFVQFTATYGDGSDDHTFVDSWMIEDVI